MPWCSSNNIFENFFLPEFINDITNNPNFKFRFHIPKYQSPPTIDRIDTPKCGSTTITHRNDDSQGCLSAVAVQPQACPSSPWPPCCSCSRARTWGPGRVPGNRRASRCPGVDCPGHEAELAANRLRTCFKKRR